MDVFCGGDIYFYAKPEVSGCKKCQAFSDISSSDYTVQTTFVKMFEVWTILNVKKCTPKEQKDMSSSFIMLKMYSPNKRPHVSRRDMRSESGCKIM